MDQTEHTVRGEYGRIPAKPVTYTLHEIKRWREGENVAGRADGLTDFFGAHGLCSDCRGHGVRMVGWSDPANAEELAAANEMNMERFPFYATCDRCCGSGHTAG